LGGIRSSVHGEMNNIRGFSAVKPQLYISTESLKGDVKGVVFERELWGRQRRQVGSLKAAVIN